MANSPRPRTVGDGKRNHETLYAIIVSGVIAVVLASLLTSNPFRAVRLGYLDYSRTPAGGQPAASTTNAPANETRQP